MLAGSTCHCSVCRVERQLIAEMQRECAWKEAPIAEDSRTLLDPFASPLDLVRALHAPGDSVPVQSSDRLLLTLVRENARAPETSLWQRLLLLVFIPAIHRTTSQVRLRFPMLSEDDVCQHAMAVVLEFLGSKELRARSSHVAFTVARKIRRGTFRWAIDESRRPATPEETSFKEVEDDGRVRAGATLDYFLDSCQSAGWLSLEERNLLTQSKIQGLSYGDLALRNGHSSVAIQHRVQRVVDRLRRIAKKTPARQLELFPLSTMEASTKRKKIR